MPSTDVGGSLQIKQNPRANKLLAVARQGNCQANIFPGVDVIVEQGTQVACAGQNKHNLFANVAAGCQPLRTGPGRTVIVDQGSWCFLELRFVIGLLPMIHELPALKKLVLVHQVLQVPCPLPRPPTCEVSPSQHVIQPGALHPRNLDLTVVQSSLQHVSQPAPPCTNCVMRTLSRLTHQLFDEKCSNKNLLQATSNRSTSFIRVA
jgi:hypothetical protein